MSLVGGVCSMCCSLLMPSFFYLVLYWKELSVLRRGGVIFILVAGLSLVGLVIAQNADQLIHLHAGGNPLPPASLKVLPSLNIVLHF